MVTSTWPGGIETRSSSSRSTVLSSSHALLTAPAPGRRRRRSTSRLPTDSTSRERSSFFPMASLLIVFARIEILEDGSFLNTLWATRSRNQGRTWSTPVQAVAQQVEAFVDPETGESLSNQDMTFHSAAVGRDGTVYVAWDHATSATSGTIEIARSRDGGRSWRAPIPVAGVTAFAFEPAIAVNKRGTVGLLWYDNRNDRPGDVPLTTDVWFARSHDRGGSWKQTHVAGPFDFRTAPKPTGFGRIGEYQGLAALRRDFVAVFTQAAPRAKTDRRTSSSRESGLARRVSSQSANQKESRIR